MITSPPSQNVSSSSNDSQPQSLNAPFRLAMRSESLLNFATSFFCQWKFEAMCNHSNKYGRDCEESPTEIVRNCIFVFVVGTKLLPQTMILKMKKLL